MTASVLTRPQGVSMAAALHLIGDLPLVTPRPIDELHPRQRARIEQIEAAIARGDRMDAARLALKLESDLGITMEDRFAAMQPTEPWEADLEAALQLAAAALPAPEQVRGMPAIEQPKPVLRVEIPDAERGRAPDELARLDVLNARLSRPAKPRGRMSADDARAADLAERAELERRPHVHAEREWARDAAAETEALAQARGEEIEARTGSGRVVISSRDPLWSLLRAGRLTTEQYDTGIEVRDLYERRSEGVGSQMGGIGGMSAPTYDNSATVFYGVQRAKALQRIGSIEREVAIKCAAEPAALQMLRWVCELGHSIRSTSSGSRSFDRNVAALVRALDVADGVIRGR